VLYVDRWRTLRGCCVSVWWWGAWSSTQRRRGRGGGITSNTHRSCFLRTAAMLPWSPVASLLCVSVVVGCLVLDTAPQGKREGGVGHHQQHSPLIVPWALDGIHVASCHISPFPEKGAGCTLGDGKYLEVVVCQEEERSVKASSCCHRSVEPAASSYCVRTLQSNTVT